MGLSASGGEGRRANRYAHALPRHPRRRRSGARIKICRRARRAGPRAFLPAGRCGAASATHVPPPQKKHGTWPPSTHRPPGGQRDANINMYVAAGAVASAGAVAGTACRVQGAAAENARPQRLAWAACVTACRGPCPPRPPCPAQTHDRGRVGVKIRSEQTQTCVPFRTMNLYEEI